MDQMLMRSSIVCLFIVLLGLIAIIQINQNFLLNTSVYSNATETVKSVSSLGMLAAAFIAAATTLLILSLPKKAVSKTKRKRRKPSKKKK